MLNDKCILVGISKLKKREFYDSIPFRFSCASKFHYINKMRRNVP